MGDAFRKGPVCVDPRVSAEVPRTEAGQLAEKIKKADKPVFVAVLPQAPEYPPATVLRDLRSLTGIMGVYAVRLGTGFNAGADRQVMPKDAVDNLKGAVRRSYASDASAEVNAFVDQALQQAKGHAARGSGRGHHRLR